MNNLPKSRTNNLLIQPTDTELLVYDLETNKALCLNETSAKVWQLCDGKTDCDEISRQLQIPKEFVWVAIEELNKNNLLENKVETELPKDRVSRRKMLFKVGATAVALPLVVEVIAPLAIHAASCSTPLNEFCCIQPGVPPGMAIFGGAICGGGISPQQCANLCTQGAAVECCTGVGQISGDCSAFPPGNCTCVCVDIR